MLFMVMHKINAEIAAGGKPRKELVERMGKLIGDTIAAGEFRDGDGLRESASRVRLKLGAGGRTLVKGPLEGDNELVAGVVKLTVSSMDEAVQWSTRYAEAIGAAEVDVGPVTEAWDIGVAPKPESAVPLRVLVMDKADRASEAGTPLSPELESKRRALLDEMKAAGVFLAAERLQPSAKGARLRRAGGTSAWTDGPFAESKELISGYAIIEVDSKAAAADWAARYGEILGDCEVDIRQVYET